ncbi:MAG: TaqI-like C-terminal specificity domain-containing protein, partial [Bacteroidia bacterium]
KTPNIRKLLFEAFDLNKIVAYSFHVFDEAIVDVLIVEAKKNQPINEQFPVEIRNDHEVIATNFFNKWHLRENYSRHVNIYLSEFASKINQKLSTLIKLDEIATITQGTKPFQKGKGKPKQDEKIMREKPYVKDYRANPTFRPLLRGSLINRYKILWDNNYYISFGEWLAEPRFSANYDAPLKIVIRQTGSSLIATLDNNQFIVRDNLYTITSKSEDYSEYLILAALNSKLLNWYYQNIINNEIGEALAQVKRGHLAQLPVAKINSFLVNEIIENTKLVLSELEVNSKRNVQEKLDKIDQLVYQLYGLTEEEIKMVEESVK